MSLTEQPLLFVYGSLRPCEGHPMGQRLQSQATLVGAATMPGKLYAISWYPGLIDGADASDLVHGDVYRLTSPAATLAWLDQYEGIADASGRTVPDAEYVRVRRTVRLADSSDAEVWVYLYRQSTAGRLRILSGDWSQRPKPAT